MVKNVWKRIQLCGFSIRSMLMLSFLASALMAFLLHFGKQESIAKGKCPHCGSSGPFRAKQSVCVTCQDKAATQWMHEHPEWVNAKARRWRKSHPEKSSDASHRNYQKRKASGKIDAYKIGNRKHINYVARVGYWKRKLLMDKNIEQVAREALDLAKSEGMDDEDARWIAVGAINREARKKGIIPEDEAVSPEMNAASQAVVKQVKKK